MLMVHLMRTYYVTFIPLGAAGSKFARPHGNRRTENEGILKPGPLAGYLNSGNRKHRLSELPAPL